MPTIVITGGHHNSALVVAQALQAKGWKVVWIGHRFSARGDLHDSAEYREVTASKITFFDLKAAKLVPSPLELIRFPTGIVQAIRILRQVKPRGILSFGGYLGGTVAIAGKILGLPIFLHEQTITAGRANILIGRLADKIYLTWPDSRKHFVGRDAMVVGLPLRPSLLSSTPKQLFTRRKPTLLVMGGKQGAHVLNQFIFNNLHDLLTDFNIVHQTGTTSLTHDYDQSLSLKASLASLADCYLPLGYIGENEIGTYLRSAAIYFGRSGAHVCYELAVLGIKSILVPLMSTHDHEQHKNATFLTKSQLGLILPQSQLTYPSFIQAYSKLSALKPIRQPLPLSATSTIVTTLLSELK